MINHRYKNNEFPALCVIIYYANKNKSFWFSTKVFLENTNLRNLMQSLLKCETIENKITYIYRTKKVIVLFSPDRIVDMHFHNGKDLAAVKFKDSS